MSKNELNPSLAIFLPPSNRGLGMIKSFPLDVSHLIAWLKRETPCSIKLVDFRIHSIDNGDFWQTRDVDLDVFSNFKRCVDHLSVTEDSGIKRTVVKVLKEMDLSRMKDVKHMFFSISVLEQLSLEYLMTALCIAKELKRLRPSMNIVFFGSCPQKHIKTIMNTFSFVDMFLEDGSERSIIRYINHGKPEGAVSGLTFREDDKVIFAPSHKDEVKFNEFPMPDFSLFDDQKYRCRGRLVLPYEINRGCSKNCFYCYFTHKNSLSYKDVGRVVADLKALSERYQTNAFHFVDGAMNSDEEYLAKLCAALAEGFPGIKWSAMARPNMDLNLLTMMRKAGCVHIRWGVEYGSDRMLKKVNKDTNPETIKNTLRHSHSLGIYNYVTLLTGTRVENDDDIAQTEELIKSVRPYINAAQECVFGELGSFDITKLETLLAGQYVPPVTKRKYDEVLQRLKLQREDIIETLARKLKLTFLVVPDHLTSRMVDPGNRSSVTLPAPPLEITLISSALKKQSLFDDFEFFDGGWLLDNNQVISDLLKKSLNINQQEYFDRLSDVMLKCTAQSEYFLFFIPWWTQNIDTTLAVAKKFKAAHPNSKIVCYGPYFQLYSETLLRNYPFIDYIILGEIEGFLSNLDGTTSVEEIPGLTYIRNGRYIANTRFSFKITEETDLMDYSFYLKFLKKYRLPKSPFLMYELSRGCKYSCYFCPQFRGFKLRYKSVDFAIRELEKIVAETGIKTFYFADAALNFDTAYLEEFLDGLIASEINIQWSAYMIAENLDPRLLRKIKESGCLSIRYGIESTNPEKQAIISKNVDLKKAARIIKETHECGILTQTSFIVGFPFETQDDLELMVEYIRANSKYLDIVNIYTFKVRKDTIIYQNPQKFNIKILPEDDKYRDGVPFEEIGGLDWHSKIKAQQEAYKLIKERTKDLKLQDLDPFILLYRMTKAEKKEFAFAQS